MSRRYDAKTKNKSKNLFFLFLFQLVKTPQDTCQEMPSRHKHTHVSAVAVRFPFVFFWHKPQISISFAQQKLTKSLTSTFSCVSPIYNQTYGFSFLLFFCCWSLVCFFFSLIGLNTSGHVSRMPQRDSPTRVGMPLLFFLCRKNLILFLFFFLAQTSNKYKLCPTKIDLVLDLCLLLCLPHQ